MNANEITNTAFREARLYGHGCRGTARRAPTPLFTPSPLVEDGMRFKLMCHKVERIP
ncbi:hypothetical protein AGMMS49545_18300 [Betaproteobacteria bacterium]|nr:hypothetical protein AGMMS49545_18300 [Betaproteobacteria bacterium]GHU41554.1 hypothetical protein AGMMS50289_04880 [Betaproteobacteria bacterium]